MVRSDGDALVSYFTNIYIYIYIRRMCIIVYLCPYVLPSTTVFAFNTTVIAGGSSSGNICVTAAKC